MGNLSLVGRISLNASPFKAGLDDVGRSVEKVSSRMKGQIGAAIISAVGVKKLIAIARETLKDAHEITQLSTRFNLTTTEVQRLQKESERTGESFDSLVKDAAKLEETLSRIGGDDVLFSTEMIENLEHTRQVFKEFGDEAKNQAVKTLFGDFFRPFRNVSNAILGIDEPSRDTSKQEAFLESEAAGRRAAGASAINRAEALKIEQKIAELKRDNFLDGLDNEQKILELSKEREIIFERIAKSATERAQKELDLARNEKEVLGLSKTKAEVIKAAAVKSVSPIGSDSLTSVGNFLGTNANSQGIRAISEGNKILLRIENNTRSGGSNFPL